MGVCGVDLDTDIGLGLDMDGYLTVQSTECDYRIEGY